MGDVVGLWEPSEDERRCVASHFPDATWGADAADAKIALSFFPRRELNDLRCTLADYPSLELLLLCTAGVNHVRWSDVPASVKVASTPGATAPFIAEYVLGCTIAWARRLMPLTQKLRTGQFDQGAPVRALSELNVVTLGAGGIGTSVVRLLGSLGASTQAWNRQRIQTERDAGWPGLVDVDVLVTAVPHTRHTDALVGDAALNAFAGGPRLLAHVSRGPVVNLEALSTWLVRDGHAAAIDVWWQYPKDSWTCPLPEAELIMTPHNSANVAGYRVAMIDAACQQASAYLSGDDIALVSGDDYPTSGVAPPPK